jgi:protein SCO1
MMKPEIQEKRIACKSNKWLVLFLPLLFSCHAPSEKQSAKLEKEVLLLPVYGETRLGANKDTLYHSISDFSFINQFGDTVSQKTIQGKMYIADFFFATCQSICPKMSTQLQRVQTAILKDTNAMILSHTVNPEYDNIKVLNAYGEQYGAQKGKWHLLTGNKKAIYELAKTSYLVNALEDDGSDEGFLHSETFLMVDSKRRLRGIYDGTDSADVNRLIKEIEILKKEK